MIETTFRDSYGNNSEQCINPDIVDKKKKKQEEDR